MIIYFLFGAGLAAYGPTMMSLVADITPASHIGRAYGWYTTSLYLGMSMGPAVGSWVAEKFSYGMVFISSGILTVCLLAVMFLSLPGKERLRPLGHSQQELKPIKFFQIVNSALLACWIITFGGCFALGMFVTFIPLHAHDAGISLGSIGLIFFLQGFTNAVSRAPFGWLSDRVVSRNWLVICGMTMAVIALTGFALSQRLPHFLINAVFLGVGMAVAFPSIGAIITEVTSPLVRGVAMGGYNAAIYFGIMSASLSMGPAIEKWGYSVAFEISSSLILLLVVVFAIMMRHYQKKSQASAESSKELPLT
jgi:MFS family permease